jgi:hypothetical protein
MAQCEVCGNEYNKIASNVQSMPSLPPASTATVELLDTGWKPETLSIAVPIARPRKG